MFFDQHKVGVGVILRDEKKDLMMAASKIENEMNDQEAIEFLAMFRDIQLYAHLDFSKLILESDCMLMVKELQEEAKSFSTLGHLLKERNYLMEPFAENKIQHCIVWGMR